MIKEWLNPLLKKGLLIGLGLSLGQTIFAAGLDLSSGSLEVSGQDTISLENIQVDGIPYQAQIRLNLDGTYTVLSSQANIIDDTTTYSVTFQSTWSSDTHPTDYPGASAHFSGLIGATHNALVEFWKPGLVASEGIESMAETGSKTILTNEINLAIENGTVGQIISGSGLSTTPGATQLTIQVNRSFPLVTLVSMIAPSPDWFVGVRGLSLISDGQWQDEVSVSLFAYDSGTDSGSTYASLNSDTQPAEVISRLEEGPVIINNEIPPFGNLIFTRVD